MHKEAAQSMALVAASNYISQPPLVCKFQSSSYILTVSDGNEIIWSNSRDPVGITDPNQQVKVEIESGLEVNTEYNATVTVFTPYANISSSATFSEYVYVDLITHVTII